MHGVNNSEHWVPDASWETIDENIRRLAAHKGELDHEIGRWLLAAQRARVHQKLGFGSVFEYVERLFGYEPRLTREKLRVARAIEDLPKLRALLRTGQRAWSAVRELARVATPQTEEAWIEKTERMTVRQVEGMVAGRKPGDSPWDAKDPLIEPRRIAFELMPEDFALVIEAFEHVRKDIGPAATQNEVLRAMAERVLVGRPEQRPAYQTSITVCALCERAWQRAGGEAVEVSPAVAACAQCDGEVVGFTQIDEGIATPPQTTPVGHPTDAAEHDVIEQLKLLAKQGGARTLIRVATRAFGGPLKSVTPRQRATVRARDGGRCVVPGCRNFRFLENHHDLPRACGGPNSVGNLALICSAHHRAIHEGYLALDLSPNGEVRVIHAEGTLYGARGLPGSRESSFAGPS